LITIEGKCSNSNDYSNKTLGCYTKQPKVLLYYDFANAITNEVEENFLQGEPKLLTIKIIILLEPGTPCVLHCSRS
jgi:hypothetical protein